MKRFFLSSCLLGGLSAAGSAQHLTGKVVDAATGQPVAYASVIVLAQPVGTTSNAEGEFELPLPALPSRLVVSELGHRRDTVVVSALPPAPLTIRLAPTAVLLPEVKLNSYAAELIQKAYRHAQRQHAHTSSGQAFYRQVTQLDGVATELQEMIWNTRTTNAGVAGTSLVQGRYAERKALLSFKNFSQLTKAYRLYDPEADSTSLTTVLSPAVARYYELTLLGVVPKGAGQLVEIGFSSRPNVNPHRYQGSITIDSESLQVLRFRLQTPDSRAKSNNPAFKFIAPLTTYELTFGPGADGRTTLAYVHVTYSVRISRPFKDDVQVRASSFTSFYPAQSVSAATHSPATTSQSDLGIIKQLPYDAAFWRTHSAVKRTPEEEEIIRGFERDGAFGTLLTP